MEILKERYTITELSESLNITDHALRYYEKEFRLNIPKDERGRRYYTPDLANVMYQIKNMRDEGLEIKAIRKILLVENIITEQPPIPINNESISLTQLSSDASAMDIKHFFTELKDQITNCVSLEMTSTKEHLSKEIYKTKLELGACVENSSRRLEGKMDKHFQDIDFSLTRWRERKKRNFVKRIVDKLLNDKDRTI